MAPLPFNSTSVMTYTYTWPNGTSQFHVRFNEAEATTADADNWVIDLLNAADGLLSSDWTIVSQRYLAAGDSFSIPITPISFTSTPTTAQDPVDRPLEMSFQGRSLGGRRGSLSLYGTRIAVPQQYRIVKGAVADVDLVLNHLTTGGLPGCPVAVDNRGVVWYEYANVNYNSYYERKARL